MNDNRNPRSQSQETPNFRDRRRRNDWVTHMATILSIVSWAAAFTVLIVLDLASPEKEYKFFTSLSENAAIRNYWNTTLLPIAFGLLVASLCICIMAFVFNMLRNRRKTDKYKKSIIIIGIVTIIGIVFFVIRFKEFLF